MNGYSKSITQIIILFKLARCLNLKAYSWEEKLANYIQRRVHMKLLLYNSLHCLLICFLIVAGPLAMQQLSLIP